MTQQCAICQKGFNIATTLVKLRGKFNPTVKRKQKPNLQWVVLPLDWKNKGAFRNAPGVRRTADTLKPGQRVKACTKCIKAIAKR